MRSLTDFYVRAEQKDDDRQNGKRKGRMRNDTCYVKKRGNYEEKRKQMRQRIRQI